MSLMAGGSAWAAKLTILPEMIISEQGFGDPGLLIDESVYAGDPKSGAGGHVYTTWSPAWQAYWYPVHAIIDLGTTFQITDIYVYDPVNSNGNTVAFSAGAPFQWTSLFLDPLANDNVWNGHAVNVTTRYLRVTLQGQGQYAFPKEIVIYGSQVGTPQPPPAPAPHTAPLMGDFIGVNTFIDDPPGRLAVAGNAREYHSWAWDESGYTSYPGYPNNQNAFSPSWAAGGGWHFDIYYRRVKAMGIELIPVKMQNVRWMVNNDGSRLEAKPVSPGQTDAENPLNYIEHADHMWQFAARYASAAKADSLLKLASSQARLSGLNYVRYYENWNEPDKTWHGREGFFHPFEYAAMASADYDGHRGAMPSTVGVKNADPQAKMVMAGTASSRVDYLKMIKFWADRYRGGSVPFDVINIHHYSNTAGGQGGGSNTVGICPEADSLKEKISKVADFRDRYMPGKELWVSEFGYDTNALSKQRAPAIGTTFSAQEVQAQWLVRSYLALAAAGVDKAQMFMLRDNNGDSSTTYDSSGLISSKTTGFQPKISWYYVYTLRNRLRNMRYTGEKASGNPNVRIYKFKRDEDAATSAYVVWCPTGNATAVANYSLSLEGSPSQATLVTLAPGSINGTASPLAISGGAVTLNVSERPVFVLLGTPDPEVEPDQKLALNASMVFNESGVGDAGLMVDEQASAGDPYNGNDGSATTRWETLYSGYPHSAYIDLGQEKHLTAVCYYDAAGIGDLVISVGSPQNWTVVETQPTVGYYTWSIAVVNRTTRFVRLTRMSQGASFNEVVLYGRSASAETETWVSQDIGSGQAAGSASFANGVFTVRGAGANIKGNTDQCHFVYLPLTGNGEITARVASQLRVSPDWGDIAGVMIRDSLSPASRNALVYLTPGGTAKFQYHTNPNDTWSSSITQNGPLAPYWVRLARNGNVITGSISSNGTNWTTVGSASISLNTNAYIGLTVCSKVAATLGTATFDQVTIAP